MTTFGTRTRWSALALESIAAGSARPRRLVLWVDDKRVLATPPPGLRRLQRRGLEIRQAEDFGPHKKYYPYVEEESQFAQVLVTADDDVIYPSHWLDCIFRMHLAHPDDVVCYRARRVDCDGKTRLAPYASWPFASGRGASMAFFPTGHSGVLYPAAMLRALKARGRGFLDVAPRADDVWLHNTAVKNDIAVRMVFERSVAYPALDFVQASALKHENVFGSANDRQLAATYSEDDLAKLARAVAHFAGAEADVS